MLQEHYQQVVKLKYARFDLTVIVGFIFSVLFWLVAIWVESQWIEGFTKFCGKNLQYNTVGLSRWWQL